MRYSSILFGLLCFTWALAQGQTDLTKKEARFVKTVYAEDAYTEALDISIHDSAISVVLKVGDRIHLVRQQDQVLGYLLSTRAMGRVDYFDYLLAFAPDLSVLDLTVTVYRSSHGAAICQKKWLSQFKGYTGEELHLGREIDAISGATISATSLLQDLKRCYQLLIRLREVGHIN